MVAAREPVEGWLEGLEEEEAELEEISLKERQRREREAERAMLERAKREAAAEQERLASIWTFWEMDSESETELPPVPVEEEMHPDQVMF